MKKLKYFGFLIIICILTVNSAYMLDYSISAGDLQYLLFNAEHSGSKKAVISCITLEKWPDNTMVRIRVPALPGVAFDIWCYEDELGKGECFPQADGSMILKHQHPSGANVETTIVPHNTTIDWYVTITGPTKESVQNIEFVNPCWQFLPSELIRSQRDDYVESFVNRCFIYTDKGFTFFKDTSRFPDTRKSNDDYRNTPPWVQSYYPVWREWDGKQLDAGWGISHDRPVYSLIGIVSNDNKYLAAWGAKKSNRLSQGWHDCLHIRPLMQVDYDAETNTIVSHSRIYIMKNDPDRLLKTYKRDFIVIL